MFTSGNNQNPFSYSTETFFKQPYTYDQNPISAHEEPPFIINFTSPFLDDHESPLSQILPQQQPLAIHADVVGQNENTKNNSASMGEKSSTEMVNEAPIDQPKPCEVKPSRKRNLGTIPRKRTGKKDRHSKICTAQGIRDRRMRLSLQIARKFFDLQDMLGFDKASKTIEWLFSKSKKAIKELTQNVPQTKDSTSSKENSESFISECEVVSVMEEDINNEEKRGMAARDATLVDDPCEKEKRKLPKVAYNFHHARESRDKARARARERTKEKMRIKGLEKTKQLYVSSPNNLDQLGSFSHFETLEESTSCTKKSSSHEADSNSTERQFDNVGITENYLGTGNFTQMACPFFSYQNTGELSHAIDFNNSFLGFLGNWDNNSFRINSSNDAIMNMVSLAGNPASTCLATSKFPFNLQ